MASWSQLTVAVPRPVDAPVSYGADQGAHRVAEASTLRWYIGKIAGSVAPFARPSSGFSGSPNAAVEVGGDAVQPLDARRRRRTPRSMLPYGCITPPGHRRVATITTFRAVQAAQHVARRTASVRSMRACVKSGRTRSCGSSTAGSRAGRFLVQRRQQLLTARSTGPSCRRRPSATGADVVAARRPEHHFDFAGVLARLVDRRRVEFGGSPSASGGACPQGAAFRRSSVRSCGSP